MPSAWDDWTLAAEVQRARLLLTNPNACGSATAGWRIDGKHLLSFDPAAQAELRRDFATGSHRRPSRRNSWNWASIAALAGGTVTFCCGLVVASSLVAASTAVVRFGVPLMLIGLFGLAVGVLLQLHRLRRESRTALDRMRLLDLRLQEYRQAALLVGPASQVAQGRNLRDYSLAGARLDDTRFRPFELVAAKDF